MPSEPIAKPYLAIKDRQVVVAVPSERGELNIPYYGPITKDREPPNYLEREHEIPPSHFKFSRSDFLPTCLELVKGLEERYLRNADTGSGLALPSEEKIALWKHLAEQAGNKQDQHLMAVYGSNAIVGSFRRMLALIKEHIQDRIEGKTDAASLEVRSKQIVEAWNDYQALKQSLRPSTENGGMAVPRGSNTSMVPTPLRRGPKIDRDGVLDEMEGEPFRIWSASFKPENSSALAMVFINRAQKIASAQKGMDKVAEGLKTLAAQFPIILSSVRHNSSSDIAANPIDVFLQRAKVRSVTPSTVEEKYEVASAELKASYLSILQACDYHKDTLHPVYANVAALFEEGAWLINDMATIRGTRGGELEKGSIKAFVRRVSRAVQQLGHESGTGRNC